MNINRVAWSRQNTVSLFEKIENLINLHFRFCEKVPHETRLIISTCTARLKDTGHICAKNVRRLRERLTGYIETCLSVRVCTGEFIPVPVAETTEWICTIRKPRHGGRYEPK